MSQNIEATTCRLIRDDGTRWSVQKLDLSGPPARAVVTPAEAEDDASGEDRELTLVHGDRIEWRRSDGTLVWATRIPVTTGENVATRDQTGARREGAA